MIIVLAVLSVLGAYLLGILTAMRFLAQDTGKHRPHPVEAEAGADTAGEPRTALLADPGPVALPAVPYLDGVRERRERTAATEHADTMQEMYAERADAQQPDANASVLHWGPPIDVFARMALASAENGVPWPAAERPARVAPTMFRDDTGSQPAIPEQHRATQPNDFDGAAERDRYFGQPAAGHPCCRHCTNGVCILPHEVACIDCHVPAYGEVPVAAVLAGEAQAARSAP